MAWFILNGSDPTNPQDYNLLTSLPKCCGNTCICAIQANNDGYDKPQLTLALQEEIKSSLARRQSSINVILKD